MMAAPAPAQTMAEAAWANMAVAVQLCETRTNDMTAKAQAFRNTGFSEWVERSSTNSDTTHWFTAPADTVVAELYYGEMPENCSVKSAHLGVTLASQLLDELIPTLYPTYVRKVETGPAGPSGQPATCVRYEDPSNEIGQVIGSTTEHGCVDNGTSLIFSSYRV
ncbi:MAG: hypothetical protein Q7J44_22670 [Pseudotabrizicola sp.]|uniref:hypothetical protein n=1 Tax=Pseudotabrizicola sp. TaxID=2939647 RepID=UPI0027254D39|nr:hypothetical protein [Pseudotabrizicola sp.]MDO9641340.1 hypothetical protein [Pseudotabrizicola sp.]